jgi:RNA polymerase sigma factor (sigma-70 family)
MPSGLDALLQSYCRAPVLSPSAQLALARQVRAWLDWPGGADAAPAVVQRRGIRARQRLVETNLKLVITVANKWRRAVNHCDDQFQDLIQAGALGLQRSVEKFDPALGYAFSTYAYWWIQQAVRRHLENNDLVRLPSGLQDRYFRLSRLISNHEAEHGCRPSVAWLADTAGLTPAQVESACVVGKMRVFASLNFKGANHSDSELGDLIAADTADELQGLEDESHTAARVAQIHQLLDELPEREQVVLRGQLAGRTLNEIGAELGVSRSRVGQLRAGAITTMRERAAATAGPGPWRPAGPRPAPPAPCAVPETALSAA